MGTKNIKRKYGKYCLITPKLLNKYFGWEFATSSQLNNWLWLCEQKS